MTNNNGCPGCGMAMEWQQGDYHCGACETVYRKIGYCNLCSSELEKLQACGATNYFCPSCNELKSKSTVKVVFDPVTANR